MGWNLRSIAFDQEPDASKLDRLGWLAAYRLFRHADRAEWYLEGPYPEGEGISLCVDVLTNKTLFEPAKAALSIVGRVRSELLSRNFDAACFDAEGLLRALMLSEALGQSLLYAAADDEGLDSGYICRGGALAAARIRSGWVLVIDEGDIVRLEEEYSNVLWETANLVAAAYFERPVDAITFDVDFSPNDYRLVAARGEAPPLPPKPEAEQQLQAVRLAGRVDDEALQRIFAIMEPFVHAALDDRLIAADRRELEAADENLGSCLLFAHERNKYKPPFRELTAYLSEVSEYLRSLRPKPEFRKERDFPGLSAEMRETWARLKTTLEGEKEDEG